MTYAKRHHTWAWRVVAAAMTLACVATVAHAQTPMPRVTYDLDFATDFNLLLHPNDPVAQHFAMWKTPAQLASLRSAPMIRLTNRGDSDLKITQLRMDMGRAGFLFDSIAFLEQPDNGPATVISHSDLTFGGDMESFVTFNFAQGLNPGDSFTFQVRLANLNSPSLANYEDVLWDKTNALFSPDRSNNALITVVASNLSTTQPVTLSMTPIRLFEYPLGNANFPSANQPDTNGGSGFSTVLPGGHEMEIVGLVRFTQTMVIPEPSTTVLASLGAVAVAAFGWRRRRSEM